MVSLQRTQHRSKRRRCHVYSICRLLAGVAICCFLSANVSFFNVKLKQQTTELSSQEEDSSSRLGNINTNKHHNNLLQRVDLSSFCDHTESNECCVIWDVPTDDWWLHHYDWMNQGDNLTYTCFVRITDPARRSFISKLHSLQWQKNNSACRNGVQNQQISSGYAAALMAVARSFNAAFHNNQAFQITKRHVNANWNFSPKNRSHWVYCPTEDMNCYFLPLSNCKAELGRDDAPRGSKPTLKAAKEEFFWLRQYAFRLQHKVRYQLQQFFYQHKLSHTSSSSMTSPCTAIHVRRTDIAFGKGRRYLPVQDYIDAGNITKHSTIVLLTDDASTLNEIHQFHQQDYKWVYLERPRFRGAEGGFEGFVPSQDPAFEVLSILADAYLVSHCNKLIHGKSGFVQVLVDSMQAARGAGNFELVYVENQQDKRLQAKMDPHDRASMYWENIHERHGIKPE